MATDDDPRVFFAAERTLLAWIRTGLGIIGLGFVVARFGLFMRLIVRQNSYTTHPIESAWIGVALVGLGSLVMIGAAVQFLRFCRTLTPTERPHSYWLGFPIGVAAILSLSAAILAIYLADP